MFLHSSVKRYLQPSPFIENWLQPSIDMFLHLSLTFLPPWSSLSLHPQTSHRLSACLLLYLLYFFVSSSLIVWAHHQTAILRFPRCASTICFRDLHVLGDCQWLDGGHYFTGWCSQWILFLATPNGMVSFFNLKTYSIIAEQDPLNIKKSSYKPLSISSKDFWSQRVLSWDDGVGGSSSQAVISHVVSSIEVYQHIVVHSNSPFKQGLFPLFP